MALKAHPDEQAQLLHLQTIDTKLEQLDRQAKRLPVLAELAELTAKADALAARLRGESGEVEDARLELTRVESDTAVVEARIARDVQRIESSSSAKDVAGLEHELAGLRKRRDDLDEIQLGVMERLESLQATADATAAELEKVREQLTAKEAERDQALAELASERTHAQANRSTIAGKISAPLLDLYERQRARYGFGASLLRYGKSMASGVALNASDLAQVRAAAPDDVVICPDSQAILVRTDESGI